MFADDDRDTAEILFAIAFGLVGSRYHHPLTDRLALRDTDLKVLERISEISFIRSSAILRIDDTRGPARTYR
jgi:hypothetical protein